MLKRLTTKNFRKLTDNIFEFGPGLQVVRGANEAGKSTIFEAVGYALFGIKACREDLSAVVTWGQPERSLLVTLTLVHDNVEYTVKRSKGGAEINYLGGRVVGQAECTAFVERLLGADAKTLPRLMLSPQGAIRGALEGGSKPTMELIENLANFDVIDQVIELIQSNLLTGPAATSEDRVARAQEAVTAAQAAVVTPDTETLKARVVEYDAATAHKQEELKVWAPQHDAAVAAVREAERLHGLREALLHQLGRAQDGLEKQEHQRDTALVKAETLPDPAKEAQLQAQLDSATQAAQRITAHTRLVALQKTYPAAYWEGDAASLQVEIQKAVSTVATLQADRAAISREQTAAAQAMKKGEDTCAACGQKLPNAEAIRKHNEEAQTRHKALGARLGELADQLKLAEEERNDLAAVASVSLPFEVAARELAQYVTVDWNCVPPRLAWKGEAPTAAVDTAAIVAEIATLRKQAAEARAAAATAEALNAVIVQAKACIADLGTQVKGCTLADKLQALKAEFERVASQYNGRVNDIAELRHLKQRAQDEIASAQAAYELQQKAVYAAQETLKRAEQELVSLNFNNNLLKRVRAARPMIADKLWGIVLMAVSSYFSAMRGQKSVVTRSANAFKVDGQSIEGLSGSTLDILGLSIRLALTRTFLPTASFLILDEPAAACDEGRENSMLGFLVACEFPQTLLVTHSDVESVAQNLITL